MRTNFKNYRLRLSLGLGLLILYAANLAAAPKVGPRVVVSIAPIHALVAGVTEGVTEPVLLLSGLVSPHSYQLRPSQMRVLQEAELVIWVGGSLETFLAKPLTSLRKETLQLALIDAEGLEIHATRAAGLWAEHESEAHADHQHELGFKDPHLWLSPKNAQVIVRLTAEQLVRLDPKNQTHYLQNAHKLTARIMANEKQWRLQLAGVEQQPFLVLHDAFQYLEKSFVLSGVGAVVLDPDRKPSAKRLLALQNRIKLGGIKCLFREPQIDSKFLSVLTEGSSLKVGVLDALGDGVARVEDVWFELMQFNVNSLQECLG